MIPLKTKFRILNSFTAVILALVLLIIPVSTAMAAAITPDDINRKDSGDISAVVQIDDTKSFVKVTQKDGTVITPDASGNYINVPSDSKIAIHYEFLLPDNNDKPDTDSNYKEYSYLAGDTYTVKLPIGLKYSAVTGIPLYTDDKGTMEIGTLAVDSSGNATVTFNDYVETESKIHGHFDMNGTFSQDAVDNGTPVQIVFGPTTITITPQAPAAPALGLQKKGSYDAESNTITWKITVTPPTGKPVSNVSLEDVYSSNQSYVADSFMLNTDSISDGDLGIDATNHKITYNFPGDISGEQVITYQTTPAAGAFSAENATTANSTFQNTATLKVNDVQNGNPVTDKVNLDWISKTPGAYSYGAKTFDWSIKVGITGQTIKGAMITDQLPDRLALDTNTVKWKAPDGSSSTLEQDTANPTSPTEGKFGYDSANRIIKYNAGTLTGQGTLSYSTTVTDPDTDLNNNSGTTYENKASLSWTEGSLSGTPSASATGTVGPGGLIAKSGSYNGNFDYKNPIIHWTITVNKNKVSLPSGIEISDTIPSGQKFLPETFKLNNTVVTPSSYDDNNFSYTFSAAFTDTKTITYDTEITDFTTLYVNNGGVLFKNDATLKNGATTYPRPGQQSLNSQILDKSIKTAYNYDTHQITWQITVNRNNLPMTNAKVTDNIPAGMAYVPGSLAIDGTPAAPDSGSTDTVVSYTFKNVINEQHIVTLTTQLTDDQLKTPFNAKPFDNRATLTATEITTSVTVKASSTINNPIITKNADYTSGDDTINWTVEINKPQIYLGKGITLTDDLNSYLKLAIDTVKVYPATVNPSNGNLTAGTTPISADQYTVRYDTAPAPLNRFTLTFKNEIKNAYVLKFTTDVLPFIGTIKNQITLGGMANGQIPSSTANQIQVDSVNAGGGGTNGSISILKTDPDGNPLAGAKFELLNIAGTKIDEGTSESDGTIRFDHLQFRTFYIREVQPPEGYLLNAAEQRVRLSSTDPNYTYPAKNEKAEGTISFQKVSTDGALLSGGSFELTGTDYAGNLITKTASSLSGTVSFKNIPLGDNYEIREITAPKGFLKSDTVLIASVQYNGDKTDVTTNISQSSLENTSSSSDVSSQDSSSSSSSVSSKPHGGGGGGDHSSSQTSSSSTPSGTDTSSTSSSVSSSSSESAISSSTSSVSSTVSAGVGGWNASLGSIYIKKADKDGKALSGAEFTLTGADGKILQKKTTGSNGLVIFSGLKSGEYSVQETKAPAHYELYTTPLDVTLSAGQKVGFTLRDRLEGDTSSGVLGWVSDNTLPKTGEIPVTPIVAAGGLLLIATGVIIRRAESRKKQGAHSSGK